MISCSEKKNLSNPKYVQYQFYCVDLSAFYKNVFIHTSLLEGLIVRSAEEKVPHTPSKCSSCGRKDEFRTFRKALDILDDDIVVEKDLLHKIYNKRNELAHDFVTLDQDKIDGNIKVVWKMILQIYKDSEFLNNLFYKYYQFRPKEIIMGKRQAELEQDS